MEEDGLIKDMVWTIHARTIFMYDNSRNDITPVRDYNGICNRK